MVFKHPSFIKKIPEPQRPAYVMDQIYGADKKYGISDFTAYESHFTPQIFKLQSMLYHHMMQNIPGGHKTVNDYISIVSGTSRHSEGVSEEIRNSLEFLKFLETEHQNVCQSKFVTIIVKGKRLSGEMDTSLGNGVVNWTLFEAVTALIQVEGSIVVEGDDGLFSIRGERFPTNELYHALGFIIDIVIVPDISKASFCGMLFDPGELTIVTDPRKVLARTGLLPEKYHRANAQNKKLLIRARAYSLVYQYGSCPIIGAVGRALLRLTRSVDMRKFQESRFHSTDMYTRELLDRAMSSEPVRADPGPQTRLLVEELYGISEEEQVIIEEYFDNLTELKSELDLPDLLRPDFFPPSWITYANTYAAYADDQEPVLPVARKALRWEDVNVVCDDGKIKQVCPARGVPLDTTDLASLGPLRLVVEQSLTAAAV